MNNRAEKIRIKIADWRQHREALLQVRYQVFVVEQRVPEDDEWDGMDESSRHAMATDLAGNTIGTGRLLPSGKIGRMAVLESWRNRGVGGRILGLLLEEAVRRGHTRIELSAQIRAIPFYERHGFTPYGDEFMDAGIPHRMMARDL
ncbi:MAG: GNAT family N-acetyltransferase [Pseudomonadota bacterium]|nr:GNAT family N-acetyltransferase [Pseudomonadota bacterium]